MATRPGIRLGTLNQGYNTVGRPTSPAADRGSGVKRLNSALAGSQKRTQILATGRRGNLPQSVPVGTAATALGIVAQNAVSGVSQALQSGREFIQTLVPDNVPLIEIPFINEKVADIPGVNTPLISNPVEFADALVQTSGYSPALVDEARIRAEKGDVLSKIYVGTADTIVKGADDLYQRVQKPGYTPSSKSMAGVLKAGAGALATPAAILQAANYLNNPKKLSYSGNLPQSVSGINIAGSTPNISGTITVSIDEAQAANAALGTVATSAGELAKKVIPQYVEAIKQEAIENPYGLAGQVLGGALLAKGVSSALPKKVSPRGIEGQKTTGKTQNTPKQSKVNRQDTSNVWVDAEYTIKTSARDAITRDLPKNMRRINLRESIDYGYVTRTNTAQKVAGIAGVGVISEMLTGSDQEQTNLLPQKVATISYTKVINGEDGIVTRLPTKKEDMYKESIPTRLPTKKEDMYKESVPTRLVTEELNYRDSNNTANRNKYDIIPRRVDVNANSNLMKYDIGTVRINRNTEENKNKRAVANKNKEENAERTRNQNRVEEGYIYEYTTVSSPRVNRGKRRVDIDIELPKRTQKKRVKKTKKYAKRQIVNPLPWLWDEEPSFSRKLPQKVEMVSVDTLLA